MANFVEYSKAYKGGHADGVFKRGMKNLYAPFTDNWHMYNAGYLKGHAEHVDTSSLKRDDE